MKDSFRIALKPLAAHEGKFSNRSPKDDPGGATMRGVTQRTYDGFNKIHGKPQQSVRLLSDAEHDMIYKENFWDAVNGDELPLGIDYCTFDGSVNSGPTQSGKWLQRALAREGVYHGVIDGHIGTSTLGALEDIHASEDAIGDRIIDKICDQRLAFMRTLSNYEANKNGWERRVAEVRKISKSMNNHQVPMQATPMAATESAKAYASETKVTETPEGAVATRDLTLTGGGILTWLLSKFDSVSDYVGVISGMQPATAKILLEGVFVVAIVGLSGYAIHSLWNVIQRKKRGENVEAQ